MIRLPFVALALGGVAFIAGGVTHPSDSGEGTKIEQLHEMLVHPSWYPSHLLLLLGTIGFAVGAWALRGRGSARMRLVTRVTCVVALVTVAGMAVHTLEGLNADHLADGEGNLFSTVQTVNETVIDTAWGVAFAVLALVGGLSRSAGNLVTAVAGLVGGLGFALASATIAYTDRFDPLFPVGALLGLWAIVVGVREATAPDRAPAISPGAALGS
jgi:hypothetical protein